MAKLVEILAKELGEWPEGCEQIWQSERDLEIYLDGTEGVIRYASIAAEDRGLNGARVTREMWEAERRKIKGQELFLTACENGMRASATVSLEPDWSKAPDWADRHGFVGPDYLPVWLNGGQYSYCDSDYGSVFDFGDGLCRKLEDTKNVTVRPARPTSPQRNGKGLPSVGAEVECQMGSGIWRSGKVIGHDDIDGNPLAVCRVLDSYYDFVASDLRPIDARTPREKWIEAADNAIGHGLSLHGKLGAIYDAGLAKLPRDNRSPSASRPERPPQALLKFFFRISIWTVCFPIILSNSKILDFTAADSNRSENSSPVFCLPYPDWRLFGLPHLL